MGALHMRRHTCLGLRICCIFPEMRHVWEWLDELGADILIVSKEFLKDPKLLCCLKGYLAAAVITSGLKLRTWKLRVNFECLMIFPTRPETKGNGFPPPPRWQLKLHDWLWFSTILVSWSFQHTAVCHLIVPAISFRCFSLIRDSFQTPGVGLNALWF